MEHLDLRRVWDRSAGRGWGGGGGRKSQTDNGFPPAEALGQPLSHSQVEVPKENRDGPDSARRGKLGQRGGDKGHGKLRKLARYPGRR